MLLFLVALVGLVFGNAEKIILTKSDFPLIKDQGLERPIVDLTMALPLTMTFLSMNTHRYLNLNMIEEALMKPLYVGLAPSVFDFWSMVEVRICWSATACNPSSILHLTKRVGSNRL